MNEPTGADGASYTRTAPAAAGSVDLHAHTTASDGARSPLETVTAAAGAGLAALAITDHDTVGGVAAAIAAAAAFGVRIVPGIELSVFDGDREVHLLGLHLDRLELIEDALADIRDARVARAVTIVGKLNALGVPVTVEAVLAEAAGGAVGRPHVARAIIAGGWARDQRDAFDRYLGAGRPANVEKRRLELAEGIRLVHEAGGIAVVAHPGPDGRREFVEPAVAMGLDGLEVRHPGHSAEDVRRIAALVRHFDLVPSGGSDWHGAATGPRVLGSQLVPPEWLALQDARVAARRAERVANA
ncbi:MAG: PHP domain-containing protein [Gemmatimonadetes bacterium]|nr:PHP domain-containing protein [Gemmatimonadota bacterium]MBI3566945.1 PHP domain-containing protein [Gemmatimonadota bacterium]